MKLLTADQVRCLINNGNWNRIRRCQKRPVDDFVPVVKLFCPWIPATWLLTEINPHDRDMAYGLHDFGIDLPQVGRVSLSLLKGLRGGVGTGIEQDRYFRPAMTLAGYAKKSCHYGRIVS